MDAKQRITDLLIRAIEPGGDFVALAQEHGQGPERTRGGDLGWLTSGRMSAEWDAVVFALKPGDISEPIETQSGCEIVKVWEVRPERVRALAEVHDSISNTLLARARNEKRRDVLRDLKAAAVVEQLVNFDQ